MLYLANNRLLLINNGNSLYRIESTTDSFQFTINTTLGSNAGSTFQLGLKDRGFNYLQYIEDGQPSDETPYYTPYLNYNFIVDWGDGQTSEITSWDDAEKNHIYAGNGEYQITISGICEGFGTFDHWYNYDTMTDDYEKIISIDKIGYVGFKDLSMFMHLCENLTSVSNVSHEAFKDVTTMHSMFDYCPLLASIDVVNWDVSKVVDMTGLFATCQSLTTLDLSTWDVSSVKTIDVMFNSTSLTNINVTGWNTSNITYMGDVFAYSESLTNLDLSTWDVSNVTYMVAMFNNCSLLSNINVSGWNTSNVDKMFSMFNNCTSLTTLDLTTWDVSSVTTMSNMFKNCGITSIDLTSWNVGNVTSMFHMFYNTALDTTSYDAMLNAWNGLPSLQNNVNLHANLTQYSCAAEEAHDTLTSSPNNWSIIDADLNVDSCDDISIPMDIGTGFNRSVISLIQDNNNKYVIGGNFSSYNGQFTNKLIRLEQDGTKDLTFHGNVNGTVGIIMEVTGDKYFIHGGFDLYNGVSVNKFVRVYQDGSIDTSFNTGTGFGSNNFTLWSITEDTTEDTNIKYLIGGMFTSYQGVTSNNIIRLNQDGSIDTSFNTGTGFNNVVDSIVEDNGKYVVVGRFTSYNGITSNRIIRLNYDGSVDTNFNIGTGFNNVVASIIIDNTGKYIIGGMFSSYNGVTSNCIIRLNQDGGKDTSFNTPIYFSSINQIKQDINGKYIVNGYDYYNAKQNLNRLENDGSRDTTFSTAGFNQNISNFIIDNNNNFVVVGYFTEYNGTPYNYIIKLNQDGTPAMVV